MYKHFSEWVLFVIIKHVFSFKIFLKLLGRVWYVERVAEILTESRPFIVNFRVSRQLQLN